ncbi:hypothetical protein QS257_14575 [Terrilactibacillus sp. S3-3]|nr:hypothetical protein QS257_14575 [Terrilactibacillus sp. S3-3]
MVSRLDAAHYHSLILGFMQYPVNQLSVYTLNGDKIQKKFTTLYKDVLIGDLNQDTRTDMTVIVPAGKNGKAYIDVYQFNDSDEPVLIGRQLIVEQGTQKLIKIGGPAIGQKAAFVRTMNDKGSPISGYDFNKGQFVKMPLSRKQGNDLSAKRPLLFDSAHFALSRASVQTRPESA